MAEHIKLNKVIGWIVSIGIFIGQTIFSILMFQQGKMAPFLALLSGLILLPFFITAFSATLNRIKHQRLIKICIYTAVALICLMPLTLPSIYDPELIYLSLFGLLFFVLVWVFRKNLENQLTLLNCVGLVLLTTLTIVLLN